MINLLRELVKDIEDINGDYKINVNSLPILLGQVRATKIVFTLSLIPVFTLIFYLINNLYKQTYAIAYVLIFKHQRRNPTSNISQYFSKPRCTEIQNADISRQEGVRVPQAAGE